MLLRQLYILLILTSLTGCGGGFLASTLGLGTGSQTVLKVIGSAKVGIDAGMVVNGEKTTNERLLSVITEKDCRFDRLLEDQNVCIDKKKSNKLSIDRIN